MFQKGVEFIVLVRLVWIRLILVKINVCLRGLIEFSERMKILGIKIVFVKKNPLKIEEIKFY